MKFARLIIKLALAILLMTCLFNMPYGYYQLVRFTGMMGFSILGYYSYRQQKLNGFVIFWVASAILINPFFKIALGRTIWNVVDVGWAVILLISIITEHGKMPPNNEQS